MTSSALHTSPRHINIDLGSLNILEANTPQQRVITFIEQTLYSIIRDIQARPSGNPVIVLKRITDVQTRVNPTTLEVERHIIDREVTYHFPGRHEDEAWRFGRRPKPMDG